MSRHVTFGCLISWWALVITFQWFTKHSADDIYLYPGWRCIEYSAQYFHYLHSMSEFYITDTDSFSSDWILSARRLWIGIRRGMPRCPPPPTDMYSVFEIGSAFRRLHCKLIARRISVSGLVGAHARPSINLLMGLVSVGQLIWRTYLGALEWQASRPHPDCGLQWPLSETRLFLVIKCQRDSSAKLYSAPWSCKYVEKTLYRSRANVREFGCLLA